MTDVSTYGTTFSKFFYGTKFHYDLGTLNIDATSGKIIIQATEGLELASTGVTSNVYGPANFSELVTIDADSDLNGTLDVFGQVDLANPADKTTVRGPFCANLGAEINNGPLQVNNSANITGNLVTNNLTITGNVNISGNVGGTSIFDHITINGPSDLNGNLDVSGPVYLAGFNIPTQVRGNLTVAQATFLNGSLDVAGEVALAAPGVGTNIRGDLNVAQNTDITGTLNVTQAVTLGAPGGDNDTFVKGSLCIDEDAVIKGNLSVLGNVTSVSSETVVIDDNLIVVNSGPQGTKDGGLLIHRYQTENGVGLGDVVADPPFDTGTAQGVTSTTITLKALSNGNDDFYNDMYLMITSATTGENQIRKIVDYDGTTKIAGVAAWDIVPTGSVEYALFNKPYVGMIYDETLDEIALVGVLGDPGNSAIQIQEYINLHTGNIIADGMLDVNGTFDADVNTFAVDSTSNEFGAIKLRTNGGTSETIQLEATQGTSDRSIELHSASGGIRLSAASCLGLDGDVVVEPDANLNGNNSTQYLYFGNKSTNGSWRIGIESDTLTFARREGGAYTIVAKMGS
jgi:cytoskeletal protein CcmA (bactofilin family)